MQNLRQRVVTLLQEHKQYWSWLWQWWNTITSQPLWVYLFVAVLLALCAVDINFVQNNIDPFFILPFYLLTFIFFALLPYPSHSLLFTLILSFALLSALVNNSPEYQYAYVTDTIPIKLLLGCWGYWNVYQLFHPINGRRASKSFKAAIILLLSTPFIGFPIYAIPYYFAGVVCAVVLVGLDKWFHVLREDRRLRTYLLTMLCCYAFLAGTNGCCFTPLNGTASAK